MLLRLKVPQLVHNLSEATAAMPESTGKTSGQSEPFPRMATLGVEIIFSQNFLWFARFLHQALQLCISCNRYSKLYMTLCNECSSTLSDTSNRGSYLGSFWVYIHEMKSPGKPCGMRWITDYLNSYTEYSVHRVRRVNFVDPIIRVPSIEQKASQSKDCISSPGISSTFHNPNTVTTTLERSVNIEDRSSWYTLLSW